MSQPALNPAPQREGRGESSGGTPNGIPSADPQSARLDTVDFGLFGGQIQDNTQRLRGGLAIIHDTIGVLSQTFDRYGKVVAVVGERYDQDQEREEEIRQLKAKNDGIWENIEKDRVKHQKTVSKLVERHQGELSALRQLASAGEQERVEYENKKIDLEDQHSKAKRKFETDLDQKLAQLKRENAEKIAGLEREKRELKSANAELTQQLNDRTKERDQEKEAREAVQSRLGADIKELENTLAENKAKYKMQWQPLQFYEERYQGLIACVDKIAISYFADLPEKVIDDPAGVSKQLKKKAPGFATVPLSISECSRVLRLGNVQNIIFNAICTSVWQPFSSRFLWKRQGEKSPLPEIHSGLGADGEDFQHHWKVATLKALDRLDDKVDVRESMSMLIDDKVIAPLQILLDDDRLGPFKEELVVVFVDAMDLGRDAERDGSPLYVDTTPSVSDRAGWKDYVSEEYDVDDMADLSPMSQSSTITPESLFVSPKIYRKSEMVAPAATGGTEIEIVQQGFALFSSSGIFNVGKSEWERIRRAGREEANNMRGGKRRLGSLSTSINGMGLGIGPGSPQEPSKRWSRQGTQEFD